MALFGKKPLEKIKDLIGELTEEEKAEVVKALQPEEEVKEPVEAEEEVKVEEKVEEAEEEPKEEVEAEVETEEKSEEETEPKEEVEETEPVEEVTEEVKTEEEAETDGETEVEEPVEEAEKTEDILAGLDARLKALEEKFIQKETIEDVGVSGFGTSTKQNIEDDTRKDDIIKKLGGYAH